MSENIIYQKIARIMGRLDRMPKTGFNAHFKYKFVTDADVADAVRTELAAENIAFFASMVAAEQTNGHTVAEFEFTFVCGDTGKVVVSRWFGEADDKQDKGLTKAATSAEKYFLLKTFMLSTGDKDDDPDNGAAEPRQQHVSTPPRNDNAAARKSTPRAPERAPSAAYDDGKGNSPDPRDDGYRDDFPTIREYFPQVSSGLLSMTIQDLPDGVNVGAIIGTQTKALGYADYDDVKRALELKSHTNFVGTLEALLNRVLQLAPKFNT